MSGHDFAKDSLGDAIELTERSQLQLDRRPGFRVPSSQDASG